jgi:hypothetical protein
MLAPSSSQFDPKATWPITSRLSRRAPKSPLRALDFSVKMLTSRCLRLIMRRRDCITLLVRWDGRSAPSRSSQKKGPRIAFLTTASPPGSQYTHAFIRGLADLGRVEGHNIAIEWRWGPWLNGSVPPVRGRSRGFERGCHRSREQSSGLGRQERPRQFPLSLRRWRTRRNKDSPRASLTREAASRGSTSRRRLAAHRPAFRIKIACNVVAAWSFPGTRSKQSFRNFAAN